MSDPFADVFEQLNSEPVTTTHGNTAQDAPATAIERRPDDAHTCHECSGTGRYRASGGIKRKSTVFPARVGAGSGRRTLIG